MVDAPRRAHAGAQGRQVLRVGQQVERHRRQLARIGRLQLDPAAAPRMQGDDAGPELVVLARGDAGEPDLGVEADRVGHDLHVGPGKALAGADHHIAAVELGGQRPRAQQRPAQGRDGHLVGAQLLEEGDGPGRRELHGGGGVFGKVAADARPVGHNRDAHLAQVLGRADPREHQKVRGIVGAAANDHLAPGLDDAALLAALIVDADRAAVLDDDAVDEGLGPQLQVRPVERRAQIGGGATDPAAAGVDGGFAAGEAFGIVAGKVVAGGEARARRGRHQGVVQGAVGLDRRHPHRAGAPMVGPLAAPAGLHLLEIGQDVGVAPAGRAHLGPLVEVQRVAAHVEHAVDRGGAAEHLAARQGHAPAVHVRLRLGPVAPVHGGIHDRLEESDGHLEVIGAVLAAGLQQQHRDARVLAETGGHHTTGGACAHHHIVEGLGHPPSPVSTGPSLTPGFTPDRNKR